MIPFFHNIRKRYAYNNKPIKYARYAVGEIVLIVIGILFALQIDNWNEDRIAREKLNSKLQSLAEAMQQDKNTLDGLKNHFIFKIYATRHLLNTIGLSNISFKSWEDAGFLVSDTNDYVKSWPWSGPLIDTLDKNYVNTIFKEAGRGANIVLNSSIVDELKSSGDFALINNDTLKEEINVYYPQWRTEFNEKYMSIQSEWRNVLNENGALFMYMEAFDDPLGLLEKSPEVKSRLMHVMFESIWIDYLMNQTKDFFDRSIERINREIEQTD